jgi:LysM repeat protein
LVVNHLSAPIEEYKGRRGNVVQLLIPWGGIKAMILYHKITFVSRMILKFGAIWGWIFEPLCGKIVIDVFACRADSSPEVERRPTCGGRCEMRREWLMVLLVVVLLVPVGCGTTEKASATSEEKSGESKSSDTSEKYTVQSGDTLMEISRKHFNDDPQYWDEIADLNDLKAPYTIYPGQELKLPEKKKETSQTPIQSQVSPTPKTYTVQSGDCLMGIARKRLGDPHRWREIANLNGIGPPYTIHPGDVLKVPEK